MDYLYCATLDIQFLILLGFSLNHDKTVVSEDKIPR